MRIAALLISAMLCSAAAAQSQVLQLLMPSPWTIGITLAQWMSKDTKKVFYVEVTAEGRDLEQARQSAFRMAVERAVGTVVSSESHVQDSRLRRDEIIAYSSGYVDDYELVQSNQLGDRTQVKMRIWVSHSRLANRLLNESRTAGAVEGGKISAQINSILHERTTGDRLLLSVLRDFPQRSFDVVLGTTKVTLESDRRAVLHVDFNLAWNRRYIESLAEGIRSINQHRGCSGGGWFERPCDAPVIIGGGGAVAGMDDMQAWNMFFQEMVRSQPRILVTVLDRHGQPQIRQCHSITELDHSHHGGWRFVDVDGNRVRVNHARSIRVVVPVWLSGPVDNLDRVEIRVIRAQDC